MAAAPQMSRFEQNLATLDLTARSRVIADPVDRAARRLAEDPATLEDLSAEFGVSRERIRQIEVRAFEKVQKAVQAASKTAALPVEPQGKYEQTSSGDVELGRGGMVLQ